MSDTNATPTPSSADLERLLQPTALPQGSQPGWYPAPQPGLEQWWTGRDWSEAYRPTGSSAPQQTVVVNRKRTSHGFHLLMTLLTLGLWLPVWVIVTVANS